MDNWRNQLYIAVRDADRLRSKTNLSLKNEIFIRKYNTDGLTRYMVRLNEMSNAIEGLRFTRMVFVVLELLRKIHYHNGTVVSFKEPNLNIPRGLFGRGEKLRKIISLGERGMFDVLYKICKDYERDILKEESPYGRKKKVHLEDNLPSVEGVNGSEPIPSQLHDPDSGH